MAQLCSTSRCLFLWSEELLIDFKEIQGEHSGENLAALVWETMELYGLKSKVTKRLSWPDKIADIDNSLSRLFATTPQTTTLSLKPLLASVARKASNLMLLMDRAAVCHTLCILQHSRYLTLSLSFQKRC